jgi:hypothetical protein
MTYDFDIGVSRACPKITSLNRKFTFFTFLGHFLSELRSETQ